MSAADAMREVRYRAANLTRSDANDVTVALLDGKRGEEPLRVVMVFVGESPEPRWTLCLVGEGKDRDEELLKALLERMK